MIKTRVINFFAGPGAGKSTAAAYTFAMLKFAGRNAELVTEYAKDVVWEKSTPKLSNQLYVFGKQFHRIWRVLGQVEFIVTDAPLLNSVIYGSGEPTFDKLVFQMHHELENINFFIIRSKTYNPSGRLQDLDGAKEIDRKIKFCLGANAIPHINIDSSKEVLDEEIKQLIYLP